MSASVGYQLLSAALLSVAITICYFEQIRKIQNVYMSASMGSALVFYFIGGLAGGIVFRYIEKNSSPENIMTLFSLLSILMHSFSIMFASLTFHTTYRAMFLIFPKKTWLIWSVSVVLSVIDLGVSLTDGVFANNNLKANFGTLVDPNNQKTSLTLIVYCCTIDTLFFVAAQAKITAVMGNIHKSTVSAGAYVGAILRSVCYSGAVFLFFMTSGGFFFPIGEAWCFIVIAPAIMMIVLLTDADRIRKLVATLQGAPVSLPSNDKSRPQSMVLTDRKPSEDRKPSLKA
ncbi:hypothetical protein DFJ73DRAFT_849286 [Zopfochytrium polystomum]|nr:hypothetical protein DFJ73DRAFT_849286 [Zopfochytrium polystomum]